jgi:hypothetical protein
MLPAVAMAAPIYGLEDFVRLFDENVDYFPSIR